MITFTNVSKVYENGTIALDNVSFHIDKGEFVFLVGPSGAGKSTVTKLLMKEEEVTDGNIIINNAEISTLKRNKVPYLRRDIGVVFQDFRLLPDRTVYDNVAFAMNVVGASKRTVRRQVPMLLSMVGLGHKADVLPTELSGGEQQRASLARALANNPPILVADEPTGNLNPKTAAEIMGLFDEINRRGTTILMVTHAREIVDTMQKRVIAIEDGLVVRDEVRGVYGYEI